MNERRQKRKKNIKTIAELVTKRINSGGMGWARGGGRGGGNFHG